MNNNSFIRVLNSEFATEENALSFFSIIVPVYNVAPYLRECLNSVLAQTFAGWECLCVDDGSTDESGAILDEYAQKDSRFRVFHQANAGAASARNRGLIESQGKYILFFDGDDLLSPNTLEAHVKIHQKYGEGGNGVTFCRTQLLNLDGSLEWPGDVHNFKQFPSISEFVKSILRDGWCPTVHGWVWSRQVLEKSGAWRKDIISNDDFEFSARALVFCDYADFISDTSVLYRQHSNGLSHLPYSASVEFSLLATIESRERSALLIEDSDTMRCAISQMYYRLVMSPNARRSNGMIKKVCRKRIEALGNYRCCILTPKRQVLSDILGFWISHWLCELRLFFSTKFKVFN